MNKTMKRTVSGLAAVGAAGAVLFGALPSDASTTTTTVAASNVPPLSPKLAFVANRWGCDGGGTLNGKECTRGAMVPKGWKWTRLSRENAKFSDRSGTQFIRLALGPQTVSTAKAVARKQAALRGTRNLKVLGVATVRVPGQSGNVYSTIVYTYTDAARTNRWVATRYLDNYGQNGRTAHIELTVGGRIQDQAGLKIVLARATTSVYEAG
jgi:hypothetical protein